MPRHSLRKPLKSSDHKYSRGVVAVAAGTLKFPGAAILAVGGARHGGAGYVKFLSSQTRLADLVVTTFPDVVPISDLRSQRYDSLVVGPGGSDLKKLPGLIPIVLDSAAIKHALKQRDGITVVTPHEGELKYLGIRNTNFSETERKEVAEDLAKKLGVSVVLKGHRTVIASAGNKTKIDTIGGAELSTAGSGDILAGLIGSMLASWRPVDSHAAHDVICGAVELHSLAGRRAAKEFTSVSAIEILESLRHI